VRYVIDGHNLIPKIGLNLAAADDELELVQLLQQFSRTSRSTVEVFFDGAPAGQAGMRRQGTVVAHFVRAGTTADSAIRLWLQGLRQAAHSWTVVSSDREVQQAAKNAGAKAISAEAFARLLRAETRKRRQTSKRAAGTDSRALSKEEIEQWLALFRDKS
jgi:predicted RNA-binding protein with PIN domain